jgi:hypothetical protein
MGPDHSQDGSPFSKGRGTWFVPRKIEIHRADIWLNFQAGRSAASDE